MQHINDLLRLTLFLLASVAITPVQGGVIATYNFDANSNAATNVVTNISASDVTTPGTWPAGGGAVRDTRNVHDEFAMDPEQNSIDAATAYANNSYFEFTITPLNGSSINYQQLSFDQHGEWDHYPSMAQSGYFIRTSLDSYATDLFAKASNPTDGRTDFSETVTLSGRAEFQNVTSALTFRVYGYSAGTLGSTYHWDNVSYAMGFDNLKVTAADTGSGSSNVPEPSTAIAMSLLGLVGFAGNRRRRRNALIA